MENNNYAYNFAEKNNLKLSYKLEQKPNMRELADKKQISKAEQRTCDYLKLIGYKVDQQVIFPSKSKNDKPSKMIVDAIINDKLVLQIDGTKWHSEPDAIIKDRRQDFILSNLGFDVLRIPYDCPHNPKTHLKEYSDFWADFLKSVKIRVANKLDPVNIF